MQTSLSFKLRHLVLKPRWNGRPGQPRSTVMRPVNICALQMRHVLSYMKSVSQFPKYLYRKVRTFADYSILTIMIGLSSSKNLSHIMETLENLKNDHSLQNIYPFLKD